MKLLVSFFPSEIFSIFFLRLVIFTHTLTDTPSPFLFTLKLFFFLNKSPSNIKNFLCYYCFHDPLTLNKVASISMGR